MAIDLKQLERYIAAQSPASKISLAPTPAVSRKATSGTPTTPWLSWFTSMASTAANCSGRPPESVTMTSELTALRCGLWMRFTRLPIFTSGLRLCWQIARLKCTLIFHPTRRMVPTASSSRPLVTFAECAMLSLVWSPWLLQQVARQIATRNLQAWRVRQPV
jgi:hypothetical protein